MTKILVIEDEEAVRENIMEALEDIGGFEVVGAANGRLGLEAARTHLPDLILCDVMMPQLNGFSVLVELQKDRGMARIPFIFLTARAEREAMRQGMTLGADDYITKPFEPVELVTAVNTRLAKQATLATAYERQLEELRHNIVMAIPHELRTPLAGIIGGAEILQMAGESIESEELIEMTGMIIESGRRLEHLIENYIVYAQIELLGSDSQKVQQLRQSETVNPDQVIRAVVLEKAQAVNRTVTLQLHAADVVLPMANDNLQKVAAELTDNAFKFSPPNTPVTITTGVEYSTFRLSIVNEGRGMTTEQINSVGAYMQFGRRLYEQQGSGLGLIISKRLVELHGRQLNVESVPQETTYISISLPL